MLARGGQFMVETSPPVFWAWFDMHRACENMRVSCPGWNEEWAGEEKGREGLGPETMITPLHTALKCASTLLAVSRAFG